MSRQAYLAFVAACVVLALISGPNVTLVATMGYWFDAVRFAGAA